MDLADLVHPGQGLGARTAPVGAALPRRRPWGRLGRLLREPLVHFLLIGALLTSVEEGLRRGPDPHRIVITPAHADQLANTYALQFGQRPDHRTLEALVRSDARDEMLFREGVAEGLDKGDEIVRRRVIQKMQFLLQDLNAPPEPSRPELLAFYKTHRPRYVAPPRASFSHIFFSSDLGGEAEARRRAEAVLRRLPNTLQRAPDRGDPFPDLLDFADAEPEQVTRVFGRTPFAAAVQAQGPGRWGGPYRSAYGWHLLYVSGRAPARTAPFTEVAERVRTDALEAAQTAANDAAFARLAKAYAVVRDDERGQR
jgi:hypothetical protein